MAGQRFISRVAGPGGVRLTDEELGWIAWAVKQEYDRKVKQRSHAAQKFGQEFDPEMLARKLEFLGQLFTKLTGGTLP